MARSQYRVSSRRWIRAGSTSTARMAPSVEGGRQGLGPTHPPEPAGEDPPALQRSPEVLLGHGAEGLVGALEDSLGPDVDP